MTVQYDPHYYPYPSRRNMTYGSRGMVCASHPLAAQAGLDVMKKGGQRGGRRSGHRRCPYRGGADCERHRKRRLRHYLEGRQAVRIQRERSHPEGALHGACRIEGVGRFRQIADLRVDPLDGSRSSRGVGGADEDDGASLP